MFTVVIAAAALATSCDAPAAPTSPHGSRVRQVTTTTAPVVEIGDAVVVERGGGQQVREG